MSKEDIEDFTLGLRCAGAKNSIVIGKW